MLADVGVGYVRSMARSARSRTARGVVAERALLTDLGVLDDPFARGMLDPAMGRLVDVLRRAPSGTWRRSATLAGLAARVAWMDSRIAAALDAGIDQVAVVGAGYDSRAWRMRRTGVRWFELDRPAPQAAKRAVAPHGDVTYVEADLLTTDAARELHRAGLAANRPAVFVLEGLTMYLDEQVVRRQLARLAASGAPGSRLLVDFTPPAATGSAANRRQVVLQRLARSGSGERFLLTVVPAEAAALVGASGWTVTDVVSLRDAALELVPATSHLPRRSVNPDKTLLAAELGGPIPSSAERTEG